MAGPGVIWLAVALSVLAAAPFLREATRQPMGPAARRDAPGEMTALSRGRTHYRWHGPARGPVVVCVHGLTTPSFVWGGLIGGLTDLGCRVLTYDLYGRGYSDRPGGVQDEAFFVGQLEELLADRRVGGDITLIGYSMGGAIATCFAARHPGRVRRLLLLAPAGMGMQDTGMIRFIRATPLIGDWLMLAFFPRRHRRGVRSEQGTASAVPDIVVLQLRELKWRGFVPAVLASLRGILSRALEGEHRALQAAGVPVLAIWGRQDAVIPLSASDRLADWNLDARHAVIEGAGHGLTYTHSGQILEIWRDHLRVG